MNTNQRGLAILVLVMSLAMSGCGAGQLFGPTMTPIPPTSTPRPKPTPENTKVISPVHFEIPFEKIETLLDNVCVVGQETTVFYSIVNTGDSEGDFEFDILFDGQLIDYNISVDYMDIDKKVHLPGHSELQPQIVDFTSDFPGEHELQIGDTTFPVFCYNAAQRPNNGYKLMETSVSGKRYFSIKNSLGTDIAVYILKYNFVVAARYIRDGGNVRIDWLEDGDYNLVYQRGTYLESVWISELNRFAEYQAYRSPLTYRMGPYSPASSTYDGFSVDIDRDWEDPANETSLPDIDQ